MGKEWKQCQTLFWGGSKITADGDCSHEIIQLLSTILKDYLRSIALAFFPFQTSVDYICVCLFLGSLFYSVEPFVYSFTNTTLS